MPLTIACLAVCGSAGAQFVPVVHTATRASEPPAIDGDLSDPAWAQAARIGPFYAYQSGGDPAAAATTLRLLWDDRFLYVGYEATDTDIRSSCQLAGACGHDSNLYDGDVLELFLQVDPGVVRYEEFEWSPLGEDFDARLASRRDGPTATGLPGRPWESGMQSAVRVDGTVDDPSDADTGWIAEARLPLAALVAQPIAVGDRWRFTGARYDFFNAKTPGEPALMMSTRGDPNAPNGGVTMGFHSLEIYDTLEFVDR